MSVAWKSIAAEGVARAGQVGLPRWPAWPLAGALRSLLRGLVPLVLVWQTALPSLAQSGSHAASAPGSQSDAPDGGHWLARIQGAAINRSYVGTMVVTAGGVVSSSRVTHICDGRQRYERIDVLDGRARSQFRHNEQLLTFWPATKVAVLEQRDPVVDFPGLPVAAGQRAADSYDLRVVGTDRVAGHEADVLVVKPRDALRFGQRWWAERETGLLLRADTLGARGEVLESSTFTEVSLAGKVSPETVAGPMKRLDGWRVVRAPAERTQLEAEGWTLTRTVPGFHPVSCAKRPLDAATDDGAQTPVLQAVFSDGLAHVSVFIEPFEAHRHKQPMRTSLGATNTLMSRRGDWWITVMGEVPMSTVQQFEAALERRK